MDLDSRTSPGHEQSHAPTSPTRRSCSWPSRGPHHCNIRQPHGVEKNDDGRLETSYRFVDFSYMLRALKRLQTPSLVLPFLDGLITRGWVVCTLFPLICWIWLSALADAREARLCRKRFVLARWTQALYVALAWLPLSTSRQATGIYHDHSDTRCHRRHEGHHLGRALRVCIDASVRFGLIHSSMHPGTGFLHPGRSTMPSATFYQVSPSEIHKLIFSICEENLPATTLIQSKHSTSSFSSLFPHHPYHSPATCPPTLLPFPLPLLPRDNKPLDEANLRPPPAPYPLLPNLLPLPSALSL